MGVDIADIRLVVHLGQPRSLLDYAQESGRSGRDGQPSSANLVHPQLWDGPDPWQSHVAEESHLVSRYLQSSIVALYRDFHTSPNP